MSSFVISKREFVKAAGLLYGIEESKRHSHQYFLDNVYKNFCQCYEYNVDSVNEQYGDSAAKDDYDYLSVFNNYRRAGEKIWLGFDRRMMSKNDLRNSLIWFFTSVLYQIENEELHEKVAAFFFTCTVKMTDDGDNDKWWGEIKL